MDNWLFVFKTQDPESWSNGDEIITNNSRNNTYDEEDQAKEEYRQLIFTSRKTPQTKIHLKAYCQTPTWTTTTWWTPPEIRTSQKYAVPFVTRNASQLTRSFQLTWSKDTSRQRISREKDSVHKGFVVRQPDDEIYTWSRSRKNPWLDLESYMRILGQINRTLKIQIISKTEEENNHLRNNLI